MLGLKSCGFAAAELERFKRCQRLAFAVLEEVGGTLRDGDSERTVARRIHKGLAGAGAQNYFHVPVALFGERTSYPGEFGRFEALPTDAVLRAGDAVILDAAPIFDGFTVDVSLTLRHGNAGVPPVLDRSLAAARRQILDSVRRGLTMKQIARDVDADIRARGLQNCHRKHIGMVLGHRVTQETHAALRGRSIWGLAPRQVGWFFVNSARSLRGKPELSPNWNHTRQSDCPAPDGLWAIEPHVAADGFGAKFEDLLVVQAGEAYYLDEDLPHTRRWAAAGI